MVIDGKTVYAGNFKIVDGKIVTPEGVVVDKKMIPISPEVPAFSPNFPEHFEKYMTPEQRQKLRILRRNHNLPKNGAWTAPSPKPTP